ncbi:MAG: hypothetical protein VX498_10955 [Myxococcota bacterium]|nr:hypothetical protein [Myxococcota bacterium]
MHRYITALVTFAFVFSATSVLAAPTKLHQQGRLLDGNGEPFEGVHALIFALYDAESEGEELWGEERSATFENGYYAITLGEQVTLDDLIFVEDSIWLELTVDGETLSPRQEVVSVPYALRATAAEQVEGGLVDAEEISIDGTVVIDAGGNWVGPTTEVDWENIVDVPADLADGDQDEDTLAGLSCLDGDIARWDTGLNLWFCDTDNQTTTLPWSALSGVPADLADGDADTQLTEAQVDAYVADNGYSQGAHTLNTDTLASLSCPTPGDRLEWDGSAWVCGAGSSLPTGVILMWSGDPATIPSGWALCDGSNGTPDLLGRFVRGTDSSNELPGTTGGDDTYTLSVAELPSHSHGVNDPGHSHGASSQSGNDGGAGANSHPHSYGSTGSSGTGISIAAAGAGQPFDNRPAYYELAYIMKL